MRDFLLPVVIDSNFDYLLITFSKAVSANALFMRAPRPVYVGSSPTAGSLKKSRIPTFYAVFKSGLLPADRLYSRNAWFRIFTGLQKSLISR